MTFNSLKMKWLALQETTKIYIIAAVLFLVFIIMMIGGARSEETQFSVPKLSSLCMGQILQAPLSAMVPAITSNPSDPQKIVWVGDMLGKTLYTLFTGDGGWSLVLTQASTMESFLIGFGKASRGDLAEGVQ